MTPNVVSLPKPNKKAGRSARKAPRSVRMSKQQATGAVANGSIAGVLIALSLSHLAHGIELAGSPAWEAWAMAIGIDLGFVGLELTKITANERTMKAIGTITNWAIVLTMMGSATLNAFAFVSNASGWMMYPAAVLGLAIPALIYVMAKNATTMWINR